MDTRCFTVNLLGDVMLGRLINQLLPTHVQCPEEERIVSSFKSKYSHLGHYSHYAPWGNALLTLQAADLNLINLETSVTINEVKWPGKVFNYRMHPSNIEALKVAKIDYVALANNHTLDFSQAGLVETVQTLEKADIAFAGAGETAEETARPAVLSLPRDIGRHKIHVYSFSDHPHDWAAVPEFNLIFYTDQTRKRLKSLLIRGDIPALKMVSVHWGPNYSWTPAEEIRSLAHFFIDECAVDVIHGHSSHHIQGVEIYRGKLIVYGCGDFIDDYAVVDEWRNDLSAVWSLKFEEEADGKSLKLKRLEVFPNRIKSFQAGLLNPADEDHALIRKRFTELSNHFGTNVGPDLGDEGQIIVELC